MELYINLPDSLKDFVAAEVTARGFSSADEYFQALLRQAQKEKARKQVEGLLDEAMQHGDAREWTNADLNEIKNEVRRRYNERNGNVA